MNAARRTSRLAIASVVMALMVFLPVVPAALAVVLGLVALVRIRRSEGALIGRGLAAGGIITGLFVLMFTFSAFELCLQAYDETSRLADRVLEAVGRGDIAPVAGHFAGSFDQRREQELQALSQRVASDLGRYQRKRWARAFAFRYDQANGLGVDVTYAVDFNKVVGEVTVRIVFQLEDHDWKVRQVQVGQ